MPSLVLQYTLKSFGLLHWGISIQNVYKLQIFLYKIGFVLEKLLVVP